MKTLKQICRGIALAGLIAFAGGCEEGEDKNVDNFSRYIPSPTTKEMHQGESSEVTVDVRKNSEYEVYIVGCNDGPSDRISVFAEGNKIGAYTTIAVYHGGHGWYEGQTSPTFRFNTTSDSATLGVHIDSADSYGSSPEMFYVNRVISEDSDE